MAYKCGALTLMEDGYCVRCGRKHTGTDLATKATAERRHPCIKVEVNPEPIEWPTFDLGFKKPTKEVERIDIPMDVAPFAGMTPVEIATELVDRFHGTFGVKISKVHFNNAKAFRHTFTFATTAHQLFLGRKTLRHAFDKGSWDYATVMRKMRVSKHQYEGALAVAWVVAHELAHVLQTEDEVAELGIEKMRTRKRKSGDVHNWRFIKRFKEVLKLVPEIV